MKQFKHTLDKSSKKFVCPSCNKKTFVKYVETETGNYLSDVVGRCDRESNCGFHQRPEKEIQEVFEVKYIEPKPVSFHEMTTLLKMYVQRPTPDHFTQFLKTKFDETIVFTAMQNYFLTGTSKPWENSTVFWQIDDHQRIRAGKIIQYDPITGKRIKKPFNRIAWMHSSAQDFNLSQCLFGLHLIAENTVSTIGIVEAEKTAVVLSMFKPEYLWLATGSKGNFKHELLKPVKGFNVVAFPDKGEFTDWQKTASDLNKVGFNIKVDAFIENTDCENGTDLADILLKEL